MIHELARCLFLGIVQGVTEFLPVSSTAHLVLIPYFAGWPDPGLAFDVALHLGTLVAVLAFFWRDWFRIITSERKLFCYLIVGTLPGAVLGALLEKKVETVFRSPLLIAAALVFAGIVLYFADRKFLGSKDVPEMTLRDSLLIGLAQAFAIIPGISRSGATISAGLWRGLDKPAAARFSFLLATPIIAGAALLKLPHLFHGGLNPLAGPGMVPVVVGVLSSAVTGFFAIKCLMQYLERHGYALFVLYRLLLALAILFFWFARRIV